MPTKKTTTIRAARKAPKATTKNSTFEISWTDSKAGFPAALSEEIARLELLLANLREVAARYVEVGNA